MQFDRTRLPVRERSLGEIMDLSLAVLRRHGLVLIALLALLAIPAACLNYLMLSDLIDPELYTAPDIFIYVFVLAVLTDIELPIVTSLVTLYLGQMLHHEQADWRRLAREWFVSLPQLLVFQFLLRIPLTFCVWGWPVTAFIWPYLNEVILLERNPTFSRKRTGSNLFDRWLHMHSDAAGVLIPRRMLSLFYGLILIVLATLAYDVVRSMLLAQYDWDDAATYTLILPAALWSVAGFMTIVRFLSYLDLRMRHEGWELELTLRAQARKLAPIPTPASGT
jgi:hypothetical protein